MRRDFSPPPKPAPIKRVVIALLIVVAGIFLFQFIFRGGSSANIAKPIISHRTPLFPSISTSGLSTTQQKLLQILQTEYDKDPKSYDQTVLTYTEGNEESWCADFISWAFLKAGKPLANPNNDYWRIPGVLSLQQYFKDNERYTTIDTNYAPQIGDVAFYIGAQTPDNTSGEHAAIVIATTEDTITTIGGNEGDGIMRLRTESVQVNKDKGLVGYGQLQK